MVRPTRADGSLTGAEPRKRHDTDCGHFKNADGSILGVCELATEDQMRNIGPCSDCVHRTGGSGGSSTDRQGRFGEPCPHYGLELPLTGGLQQLRLSHWRILCHGLSDLKKRGGQRFLQAARSRRSQRTSVSGHDPGEVPQHPQLLVPMFHRPPGRPRRAQREILRSRASGSRWREAMKC